MKKTKNELTLIDEPIFSRWSALYRSFFSRRLYVDVGKRWKGYGFIYLFLVIALLSIPFFFRMANNLNVAFKEQIKQPLAKIPVFYIQKGEVLFDKPMPYLIKNDKDQVVTIIDTTGKINEFTSAYPYLSILINKNKMYVRMPSVQLFNMGEATPSNNKPVEQKFDKDINLVFNGKALAEERSITNLIYFSEAVLYPMIVGIFFSIFITFFLVLGFLGQVFSTVFFSFKISFKNSSRLLTVAGTPMLLLLFIILTLNRIFHGSGVVLFSLLIIYYSFALYSLRAESKQVVLT